MSKQGSETFTIKVEAETGKILEVMDENGREATKVDQKELSEIYQSEKGFKYGGTILHTHNSPGCVYIIFGGWAYKICW